MSVNVYRYCRGCRRKVESNLTKSRPCEHCGESRFAWEAKFRHHGGRYQKGGFERERDAKTWMDEQRRALDDDAYVEPSKATVNEYLTNWLDGLESDPAVRPSTRNTYRLAVERVRPMIGSKKLQHLSRADLRSAYGGLKTSGRMDGHGGLGEKTIWNTHLALHRAFGDALEDGLIATNPAAKGKSRKALRTAPKRREMNVWDGVEVGAFLRSIAGDQFFTLYRLALFSGARRGELIALEWRDASFDASTITIARQRVKSVGTSLPKTDAGRRTMDIDAVTMTLLRDHRKTQLEEKVALGPAYEDHGLIFTRHGGIPLDPDTVSQRWAKLVARSGLPRIRLHDARHTHATLLLRNGVSVHVVSRRLGHTNAGFTLQQYAHVLPGQQSAAAAGLSRLIDEGEEVMGDIVAT